MTGTTTRRGDVMKSRSGELQNRHDMSADFERNRDGTLAIATGEEPDVWPEDEEKLV